MVSDVYGFVEVLYKFSPFIFQGLFDLIVDILNYINGEEKVIRSIFFKEKEMFLIDVGQSVLNNYNAVKKHVILIS